MSKFSRHLLNSDMHEVQLHRDQVAQKKYNYRRSAEVACDKLDESLHELEAFTRDLLDDGIAVIPLSLDYAARTLAIDVLRFTKKIQRQAERPLVTMVEKTQNRIHGIRVWDHWVLTMPRSEGMNNLVAPLLLQSTPATNLIDEEYYSESELPASIYHDSATKWTIMFLTGHNRLGTKAEDIRTGWLNMCKEDNLLRGCLNVPPIPVDMSDYR